MLFGEHKFIINIRSAKKKQGASPKSPKLLS